MNSNVEQSTHSLQITRVIPASPAQVYAAWTDPQSLAKWFAPADDFQTIVHNVNVVIGGQFRIEMRNASGKPHTAVGVYREITPSVRLSFTWKWAEQAEMQDTLVTLDFLPRGSETELVLTHSLFLTADEATHHNQGWTGIVERLVKQF